MLNPDDLFNDQNQADHPKLRRWQMLAGQHHSPPVVEIERPREVMGFGPARICVSLRGADGIPWTECEPWEPQLALATFEKGWRAPDTDKESVRIGLLLKMLFAQPETRYGDGYFSSVLIDELRNGGFAHDASIASLLRYISVSQPEPSQERNDCAENIKAVLSRIARLLVVNLKYPQDEAKGILAKGLAYFLDERFSIRRGRTLGLCRDY